MVLNQPNVQYIPQLENNPKRTVLTKREKEVLGYLCKGYSIREIGGALFVSERTVRTHCSNILTTLSMNSLKELILFVEKVGFENL
ncbi:MAG: LuxR C-terminal-related transcriptional regulator [Caldilineaceae bacterium]